jgi:hypothetical protein
MVAWVSGVDAQQSPPGKVPNPPDTSTSRINVDPEKAADDPTTLALFASPSKAKPVLFDRSTDTVATRWRWRASGTNGGRRSESNAARGG